MGNKIGGYSFPTEAVIAETVRTVNLFGQLYAKSVGIAALRTRQRAHEEEHEGYEKVHNRDGFQLERPPEASEPIERAWITKLGDVKKNWKKRFFVATEEADNYVVYYFERDKDAATPAKAKGSIYPCGYVIRDTLPDEDKGAEPGFGLALEPVDRKRVWYLRFESAETREMWRQVLQFSSVKCEAPLSADRVLSAAYRDAYSHARRQLGLNGYFKLDRSEKEQLAVLCVQACETNVLSSLYETITNSVTAAAGGAGAVDPKTLAEAEKLRAAVDKELDKIVSTVLDTAWPAISARVDMRKPALESLCSSNLTVILREEALRRGEVSERVSKHIRPIARDVAAPCVNVLLGGLLKPQYKAHKDALKLFWNKVHEIVETGLKENELRLFYRDSRWQYKCLKGVFSKVRVLTRGDLDEAGGEPAMKLLSELTIPLPQFAELLKGVSLYEVETLMEDHIRNMIGWAIYSFVAEVERARGGVTPIECLHTVMRKLIHDSKIRQRKVLMTLLKQALAPTIRSQAIAVPAVKEICETSAAFATPMCPVISAAAVSATTAAAGKEPQVPSASPVPKNKKAQAATEAEIRSAPMADNFLDTDWMLDDIIDEVAASTILGQIESKVNSYLNKLDKLPGKLGFSVA